MCSTCTRHAWCAHAELIFQNQINYKREPSEEQPGTEKTMFKTTTNDNKFDAVPFMPETDTRKPSKYKRNLL